jgi:signal transduction histidine kinase/PAS domain-containing protein/putative methionine-R-sulfoxide reductase with GAF domain
MGQTIITEQSRDSGAGGGFGATRLTSSFAVVVPVPEKRHVLTRYAVAVGAPVISLAATLPLAPFLQRVIFVLFWPAVIGVAWFGGIGPAVLASALSVLFVDYFLIGTPGQISASSPDDLIPFAVFLFASGAVAILTNATRTARRTAAEAAARNAELAHEIELQAMELEQQLEESQALSEELEQTSEELANRTTAAEEAELYTKGILESITDPFVVHDAEWRFKYINDAAAEVFRQSSRTSNEPPIGRVLWEAYPDIIGTPFEREMRRAATERRPVTFEALYPARGEWSRLSCFPLADGGLATQWTDITARKRAEETEHFLGRASEVLASSLDYELTLAQLARIVVPELADWCAVHIVEDGEPRQLAVAHVDPAKVAFAQELSQRYPPRLDAPTGVPNVLRTRRPEIYPEITDDVLVAGAVDAEHLRLSRELGLESALIVPLLSGDDVIGVLTLVSAESGRRYSERDLPLATELARRAAVAVEHARLHRQTVEARTVAERAAWSADRLYSLTARLTAAATPQAVAEAMLAEAGSTFGAERGTVSLIEEDGDTTRSVAQIGYAPEIMERWRAYSLRATVSATREAVVTGRGIFIESLADARARFPEAASFLERVGTETAAVLPITTDGRVRGVITLAWTTVHEIPQRDREFMERYAAQCGQALARALAFEAALVARARTERLQRLTAALADATSERDVARILVANLHEVLEPIAAAVFRVDGGDDGQANLVMVSDSGVLGASRARFASFALDGDAPIAELVRRKESVFLPDHSAFRARFPRWPSDGHPSGQEAWIGVPLIASTGAPLGIFALGFPAPRMFDADLRRYVESMGDQATQAFERVRLLEMERAARDAAEEANRAKTQFLATMSHELRTPLNAISGYAELLRLGLRGPTTPEQREDLGRIMRSQRHLLSVINDILNFARLEAGHVEYRLVDVQATELLGDLESFIRPQLVAKQLTFSCSQVPDGVVVRADAEKVQQVLLNLLANAVKFTAPGGQVQVECEYDAARVYVRVRDTGIGIPVDRRGAIFEPFVQLHRTLAQPAEGTGLGLAISRDLARGMGGELTVESEPGKGSTFTLVLDRVR